MWSLTKPSQSRIAAFVARQAALPFSYAEVGRTRSEPPRTYDVDHNRIDLGSGRHVFEAACAAMRRWRMFPAPWTAIHPLDAPIQEGQVVAMLAHVYGLWWLNACRIVYVVDDRSPIRRFGFAYGTLPGHVERGEERFTVEWDDRDVVAYAILAFSRPRDWMARAGYPLVRGLQRRFVRESQAAMRTAAGASTGAAPSGPP